MYSILTVKPTEFTASAFLSTRYHLFFPGLIHFHSRQQPAFIQRPFTFAAIKTLLFAGYPEAPELYTLTW